MSTNPYDDPNYGKDDSEKGSNGAAKDEKGKTKAVNPYDDPNYGKARGFGGHVKDTGIAAAQGVISVPEAAIGVLDMFTEGHAGKLAESKGFKTGKWKEQLGEHYSDDQKLNQRNFEEADGIIDKFGVALENPSMIANTVVQSAPSMVAGAMAGRGMQKAAGKNKHGEHRLSSVTAAAMGEGTMMAGHQAEAIRQQTEDGLLTGKNQVSAAVGTGALGTLFAWGGGRLAKKLGIGDVDTLLVRGVRPEQVASEIASAPAKSLPRQIIEGMLVEGVLEELPQSISEQILQNLALDKPWHEGVDDAAVMGTLAGAAMGGVGSGYTGYMRRGAGAEAGPVAGPDAGPDGAAPGPQGATGFAPGMQDQFRTERPFAQDQQAAQQAAEQGGYPALPAPDSVPGLPAPGQLETEIQRRQNLFNGYTPEASISPNQMTEAGVTLPPVFNEQRLSEQLGINPDAGPLSAAAATAVDSGASPFASGFTPAPSISPAQLDAAGVTQAPVWSDSQAEAHGLPTTEQMAAERKAKQQEVFGGPTPPATLHPEIMHMAGVSPKPSLDVDDIASKTGIQPGQAAQKPAQQQPESTPTERASGSWDAMSTQQRMLAAEAAGVRGVPAKNLVTKNWDKLSDKQRAALIDPVNEIQGNRWVDPNRRAKDQEGPVLQPRDRSQEGSLKQMANIASAPDYAKASYSRTFTDGAPVTIDEIQDLPVAQRGKQETVTTAGDRKIPIQYAAIEADQLVSSNRIDGTPNKEYQNSVAGKSRAIAGNGRVAGLAEAWKRGTANQYKADMMADTAHGISPEVIKGMKNPVLVRLMPQSEVTDDIGDISNRDGKLDKTVVEQAKEDGRSVELNRLEYDANGNIGGETVRDFISRIPGASNLISNGKVTQAAQDRLAAAVFQKAYNNDALTELLTERNDVARSVINGLAQAASHMAKLEGMDAYGIRDIVAQAAEFAINASRKKGGLRAHVNQADMGADPHIYPILSMMVNKDGNVRSSKYIAEQLTNLANLAHYEYTKESGGMFGEVPKRTIGQIIDDSFEGVTGDVKPKEQQSGSGVQPEGEGNLGDAGRPAADEQVVERPEGGQERPADAGQPAPAQPEAEQGQPAAVESNAPETWRTNYIRAAKVARDLGIDPKRYRNLDELVAVIDMAGMATETVEGRKVYPTPIKQDGKVVVWWAVQSGDNMRLAEQGQNRVSGDTLHGTKEIAVEAAKREAAADAMRQTALAEKEQAAKDARAQEEARKNANRGKSITERRAAAALEKRNTYPTAFGFGAMSRKDALEKAVRDGHAIVEVGERDEAARKRDEDAVKYARERGYILGASNENIPAVKKGLEAQKRLKANDYTKPAYRLHADGTTSSSYTTITKTEYDYAQQLIEDGAQGQGFDLQTQTEEELAQQEAEQKAKREAETKQKAQQEAAAKRKKDEQDTKARADEVVDDFQLGQSSDEAMSGMGDMFSQQQEGAAKGQQVTPEIAGNMRSGDIVVDAEGNEYSAMSARFDYLLAHPIVNGKAQVSADTGVMFHLKPEPDSKDRYPTRNHSPIYATGRNHYDERKAAEAAKDIAALRGEATDAQIEALTHDQVRSELNKIARDHYRGLSIVGKGVARRSERGDSFDLDEGRKALREHRDYWLKRERDAIQADADNLAAMNRLYGHMSQQEVEAEIAKLGGSIRQLQAAGSREFDGNGGRRTGAAVSAEGARENSEQLMKLMRYHWDKYVKERPAPKVRKPAHELTRSQWVDQEIRLNRYAQDYLENRHTYEQKAKELEPAWLEAIHQHASEGRIPTHVLDDVYALYGLDGIREFRGTKEKGAEGYENPDVRIWDKTYSQVRTMDKKGELGANVGSLKEIHRMSIRRAMERGEQIPENVLKGYPELNPQAGQNQESESSAKTGLPDILTKTKRQYLKQQTKAIKLKEGTPAHEAAVEALEDQYEDELNAAHAQLDFKTYNELNSGTPEGINRQAWEQLREDYPPAEWQPEAAAEQAPDQEPTKEQGIIDQIKNISMDDLDSLMDEVAGKTNAVETQKPYTKRSVKGKTSSGKPRVKPKASKVEKTDVSSQAAIDRTAADIAKSAGVNFSNAGMNALKGLVEMFGGNGRLNSGLTFDEQSYARAKPLFVQSLQDMIAGGKDLRDFVSLLFSQLGEGAKPYIKRFVQDVQSGAVKLDGDSNGSGSTRNLEQGGKNTSRNTAEGALENADEGGDGRDQRSGGESGVRTDGRSEGGEQGSAGVQDGGTATGGERGDNGADQQDGQSRLEDGDAGSDLGERGSDLGNDGVSVEPVAAEAVEEVANASSPSTLAERLKLQQEAESIPVKPGDIDNIRETVPYLLPEQQDDVLKAEQRFAKPDGYGMLFTNGTGTGKTFTGMGLIKRFVKQGKGNILIVVPDDKVASDWRDSGNPMGLQINQLKDTRDAGQGVVVTTYANLGANLELASRQWDLIVADEAHKLMQAADAKPTKALEAVRALTYHPDGFSQHSYMLYSDLHDAIKRDSDQIRANNRIINNPDTMDHMVDSLQIENAELEARLERNRKDLDRKDASLREKFDQMQGDARPRLAALSATPFSYVETIDWANGYLFDYDEGSKAGEPTGRMGRSYNEGSNRDQFFIQNFGYRMRYNKLTKPDKDVDVGLMERNFNARLRRSGALSGRTISVNFDYDRRFVLVDSKIGQRIDEALEWLRDQAGNRGMEEDQRNGYRELEKAVIDKFDYLSRRYLLEAIKAQAAIPLVKQHMAMGRKVVVFHDYIKGGGFNPFAISAPPGPIRHAFDHFKSEFGELFSANLESMPSPVETFRAAIPDTLIVNGRENKREVLERYQLFQSDDSGPQVILVQSAKNAGWSGHDTTGKHQRVLINLGLPTTPASSIQQEGRIYRVGQASNAIQRYMNTGTSWERTAFASTIATRAGTVENMAMGEQARALRESFIQAFEDADTFAPGHEGEGTGGKEADVALNKIITPYDAAKSYYFANQKKTQRTKSKEGQDYFATPEPVGLKMAEWLGLRTGESSLEPSAGHGAIARWLPEDTKRTFVEPSRELTSRLQLIVTSKSDRIVNSTFEELNIVNKFDGIAMNPPFGRGGKLAAEHVRKAMGHLRDGGRIVALVPEGPAADKQFAALFESDAFADFHHIADVKLPTVTFDRAGTNVATRVMVIEKQTDKEIAKELPTYPRTIDLRNASTINELFDRLEEVSMSPRVKPLATISVEEGGKRKVEGAKVTGDFQSWNTKHTKTGADLFMVKPTGSLEADVYKQVASKAKQYGGFWDRWSKGFRFETAEKRAEFLADVSPEQQPATDVAFSFAGQKSGTAMHTELAKAKRLTARGVGADDVHQQTGWSRGPDGKWRYEISDHDAKLKAKGKTMGEAIDMATLNALSENRGRPVIGDILDHPALFRAYPALREIPVAKMPASMTGARAAIRTLKTGFEVYLNPKVTGEYALSAMLHELQHAIQAIEGFAKGGNPAMAKNLAALSVPERAGVNTYQRLLGEVEARNTQARRQMDEAFRKMFPPKATQDVSDADAIVTFNGREVHDFVTPDPITKDQLRDVFAARFPRLTQSLDGMLAKGDKRESGGLIILNTADPLKIAGQFHKMTGRNISEAIRMFENAEDAQGFFDPRTGLTFLVGPSVNETNAAAVVLHEAIHGQQNKKLDQAAVQMLVNRKQERNADTRAFLDRVVRRMAQAEGGVTELEAAAYIVEQAIMEGRDGTIGQQVDAGLLGWIERNLGKTVADLVRGFVRAYRQFAIRNGLGLNVTVDDMIQYAQASMKQSARTGANPYDGSPGGGVRRSTAGSFKESAYRPQVVSWAKNRFGDQVAPNGRPAWQNFVEWFGDSKVVNDKGEPLVVYHGSDSAGFTEFSAVSPRVKDRKGIFFASTRSMAETYTSGTVDPMKAGGRPVDGDKQPGVYEVYLSLQNPMVVQWAWDNWDDGPSLYGTTNKAAEAARLAGYDGIIMRNVNDPGHYADGFESADVIVTFNPSSIKSATGNTGDFSADTGDIRFSRSGIKGIASAATAELNRTLNAPGKLSLWHKTIGTMYNLAERSPHFKPVFESAQGFIDDVAHFATDAAELAPTLLPSLDTWRDITKKPITSKDNAAIAKPIFEGTLSWRRDEDGKPVRMQENDDSQAGIVWTDGELRSMFGLNDKQVGLYHEFREATSRSLDTMARADMIRFGGKDLKAIKDRVMDADDVLKAAQIINSHLKELADREPDRKTALMQTAHGIAERAGRVQELQEQGYAPLSRFGKYTVDVVVDGERQYFGLFETMREANKMKEAMAAEFGAGNVSQGTLSNETYKLFAGVTPETLELFGSMLGLESTGDEAKDKAFQDYLKLTKTNRSAMRRLIHRKGVAGYSEDVGRVLASFVYSNSRQTAAGLNIGELGEAINAIPKEQGELKDAAVRLGEYIKNPQEEGQVIRGFLFAQYLGGSVASAFVNLTQPVQVTFPWLTQFTSATKAASQLGKAAKQMSTRGFKYEAGLAAALKAAEDDGTVSPQEIHQLMGQSRGKGALRAGDGTRAGEARAALANAGARLSLAWGKMFGAAEQINRRMTFIASYRIARDSGMADPAGFARRAVRETQFVYSKASKMQWGRGAVGGTLMTFKTYSVSYIELMHRLWTQGEPGSVERAQGRKATMVMLATLFLISGAGGLPFAEDVEDLIDGIAQMMGYNFSSKKAREDFMIELVGEGFADFIDKGITGLPGAPVDVSGRLGLGNLIPGTGLFQERTSHTKDMLELLGPGGDFGYRMFEGGKQVIGGVLNADARGVAGGLVQMSPVAVRNALKGGDMAIHDMYRDNKGYKVLDTNMLEAAAKAAGFQPATVARIQEANYIIQRSKNYYSMRAQEIRQMWAAGIFEKNNSKVQQARQAIADWNAKNPDQPMIIKIPDVMRRAREMAKSKDERIAATAPRAMRQQIREDLGRVRETL